MTSASTPCWSQLLGVAVKQMQNLFSMKSAKAFSGSNMTLLDSSIRMREFSSLSKSQNNVVFNLVYTPSQAPEVFKVSSVTLH